MRKKVGSYVVLLLLVGGLIVFINIKPTEAQPASSTEPTPTMVTVTPEDPLFPQDISAWTYTPEFAERFKRMKLKEPGPTGAYAVNFQVHQVEELDRCVFNVFLDNSFRLITRKAQSDFFPSPIPCRGPFSNCRRQISRRWR